MFCLARFDAVRLCMFVSSICRARQHASPSAGGPLRSGFAAFRTLLSVLLAPGGRNLIHSGHPARTEGAYNLVVRAGKVSSAGCQEIGTGSPTQQIAEWLAKIGLERYAPVFIDNDVDVEVLRYLTHADLERIGVSLGHRRNR